MNMTRRSARDFGRHLSAHQDMRMVLDTIKAGPRGGLTRGVAEREADGWAVLTAEGVVLAPAEYRKKTTRQADDALDHADQSVCWRCDAMDPDMTIGAECFCIAYCGVPSCGGIHA